MAFDEAMQKGMGERLVKYIMRRFPHVFEEDKAAARAFIDKAKATAAGYGIQRDIDVAFFADLSVMYGDDFHEHDWARDVLRSEALAPREKIKELSERIRESGALL